jgi:ATP-binding cassette, subfamily B, bacterial
MTKYSTIGIFIRTLSYARTYWLHIFIIFALNLLATPIALLRPVPLKLLIDNGFGSLPVPKYISFFFPADFQFTFTAVIIIAASLILVTALVENINVVITWVLETFTGEKLVLNFRTILFNHIQRLSLSFHDQKGITHSLYRIQWDAMNTRSLLIDNLLNLISSTISMISMLVVMFSINWRFAMIALGVIPLLYFLTRQSSVRLKKDWNRVKDDENLAMAVVHESLSALRVVKAFGQEENEQERFISQSDKALKGQIRLARIGSFYNFLIGMVFACGTALSVFLGAEYVKSGKITLGDLTLIMAYLAQLFIPMKNISKKINDLQGSVTGVERVFRLLDQEKEVEESPHALHLLKSKGSFSFSNVSFSYENNVQVLHNISFNIRAGDRVGIMGSTGAGKSTLISLLMRFYDATEGIIGIDGVHIRKFRLADYRNQFSLVLQEPVLFSTTIAENIRYGKPGATDKEIVDAAKAANAHDFIVKSNNGYDTQVGERGMQLSGGERQRISLARAFIKNAPVLILDEPTSSVDLKTEGLIMDAMERLMAGRTTFLITHRLDTLSTCNIILHIEGGMLVDVLRDFDLDTLVKKKNAFINQQS